ncbi:MAG: WbqC family protein [Candidatus Eremiobacteraeota bacterium]|nr:WbqC family protein [Candidatus Eremiobacteraeota bacterium]
MKTVVIMQPQLFPWRGLFEQIRLADEFVHLDDAQFQKGGFTNRVQIKTAAGSQWLTAPVLRDGLPPIADCELDYKTPWREKHLRTLRNAYARAPFLNPMIALVERVYAERPRTIAQLDIAGIESVCDFLGLRPRFSRASATPARGKSTARVAELLRAHGATRYVTGLGALNYLDEPSLAAEGVRVEVMAYRRTPYPQLHGVFDPHVSVLDLIANAGPQSAAFLDSEAVPWGRAVRPEASAC